MVGNDTYEWYTCPNYVHNPTLFTWINARQFCVSREAVLPLFYDRTEEEAFLAALKDVKDLFPMEAVFIGLVNMAKVGITLTFRKSQETKLLKEKEHSK